MRLLVQTPEARRPVDSSPQLAAQVAELQALLEALRGEQRGQDRELRGLRERLGALADEKAVAEKELRECLAHCSVC